jgi:hypothetical protein
MICYCLPRSLCYGCPVDRLDTWLNAQRGWRLLLVRCVVSAPVGLAGGALWSQRVTFDPATPQVRALAARMALCTAASFLLAALTLLPPAWRGPARRPDRPWPTWRLIAYLYSFFAGFVVMAYEQAEPLPWRWHNGWVFPVQLALLGVSFVMFVWNMHYLGRLRRLRDHGASPNTWA